MKARFYLVAVLVWTLDYLTKWMVRSWLDPHQALEILPGFLRFSLVRNTGVAFGLFADVQSPWKPYILAAMAVVAAVVILIYSARMPTRRILLQLALAVTLGGILGNFVDRILNGFVVDFIELHLRDAFYWPTFNLADSAITIGIALLLIDMFKNPETDGSEIEPAARPGNDGKVT